MKSTVVYILFTVVSLLSCVDGLFAQERPKLRELSDKKVQSATQGVMPEEKNEKWGYVDVDGRFLIRPLFMNAMPMCSMQVGFVSYLNEDEREVWTPISIKGTYLTGLEFDSVVKDFDDKGLAVVTQMKKYGVINHLGRMLEDCSNDTFIDRDPVYLLRPYVTGDWVVIAKDNSPTGYTCYTFEPKEPIILEAEGGYGIISPESRSVVAEFVYDSIREFVPSSVYCLQKGSEKYLYADDKLSKEYDDIIPGEDNMYFVVKKGDLYGVLTQNNISILSCSQTEIPVLSQDKYSCFIESGEPVYVKADKRLSATQYDDYLYELNVTTPVEYLLDQTLPKEKKKYVGEALEKAYGTAEFDRLWNMQEAVRYARERRFVLLSNNDKDAKFLDLQTGALRDAGCIAYHAFPTEDGAPALVSAVENGKFGMLDIRNRRITVPFEYDRIMPVGKKFASLFKEDSVYLYNVVDDMIVDSRPRKMPVSEKWSNMKVSLSDWEPCVVEKGGKSKYINALDYRWRLPDGHVLENIVEFPAVDSLDTGFAAFMIQDSKGALFSLDRNERFTDYLFESVENRMLGGKYHVVSVGGKEGLYDVAAQKFTLSCQYDDIKDHCTYGSNEYVVVSKGGKYGLYNLTAKETLIPIQNESAQAVDGYVILGKGRDQYLVYSLKQNAMVFEAPVKGVNVLKEGYAVVDAGEKFGIYDLDWNQWHITMENYKDSYEYYDFRDINDDLILVPEHGILNYKTRTWVVQGKLDWAYFASCTGDYVELRGGFEAESASIYSLKDNKFLMEYHSTYIMDVLSSKQDSYLKSDYVIFAPYAQEPEEGMDLSKTPWIPWNENEGGCGLYDLIKGTWVFSGVSGIEYLGYGLLWVKGTGVYDLTTDKWALKTEENLSEWEDLNNIYVSEVSDYGNTYLFDQQTRSFVLLRPDFNCSDYKSLQAVSDPRYIPIRYFNKWEIYDSLQQERIPFECDRISLMF